MDAEEESKYLMEETKRQELLNSKGILSGSVIQKFTGENYFDNIMSFDFFIFINLVNPKFWLQYQEWISAFDNMHATTFFSKVNFIKNNTNKVFM